MLSSSGASVVRRHSSLVAGQDLSFYSHTHLLRQPSMLTEQENIERPATKQAESTERNRCNKAISRRNN